MDPEVFPVQPQKRGSWPRVQVISHVPAEHTVRLSELLCQSLSWGSETK